MTYIQIKCRSFTIQLQPKGHGCVMSSATMILRHECLNACKCMWFKRLAKRGWRWRFRVGWGGMAVIVSHAFHHSWVKYAHNLTQIFFQKFPKLFIYYPLQCSHYTCSTHYVNALLKYFTVLLENFNLRNYKPCTDCSIREYWSIFK